METSFIPYSFAANHIWPGLYLFVPIMSLGGVYSLLVVQAAWLAIGVFPAFYLAYDVVRERRWAWIFAFIYLFNPAISVGCLFDFHTEILTVPCLLGAFLALRRQRLALFWLLIALAVSLYEITTVVLFVWGVAMLFEKHNRRTAIMLMAGSAIYLAIVSSFLMPLFQTGFHVPHWERFNHLGKNAQEATLNFIMHPVGSLAKSITLRKLRQLIYMSLSVGFLWVFRPKALLPALPLLIILLLSSYDIQTDIRFGYIAPILPFLLMSSINGAAYIAKLTQRRISRSITALQRYAPTLVIIMVSALFLYCQLKKPIRGHPFHLRANLKEIRSAAAMIPIEASLSADYHLGAHFAERRVLLLTPSVTYKGHMVDYVFIDLSEKEMRETSYWEQVKNILGSREYGPIYYSNGVLLLKRGVRNDKIKKEVYYDHLAGFSKDSK